MSKRRLSGFIVALVIAATSGGWLMLLRGRGTAHDWPGVDDTVIGSFVQAAGRPEPTELMPFIRGDLLLFAFLCAGLLAGFVLGFYGRVAFVERRSTEPKHDAE
jgi:hypothetical protein